MNFSSRHPNNKVHLSPDRSESEAGPSIDTPSYKVARVGIDGSIETKSLHTSEILKESSIWARDLFSLSLTSRHTPSLGRRGGDAADRRSIAAILPRGKEILLSFGNIRALVGMDSVMIFDAHSLAVQQFSKEIAESFKEHDRVTKLPENIRKAFPCTTSYDMEPFELVFIEEVLRDTCDAFNRRIHLYEPIVDSFLDRVSNEVFSDSGVHLIVPIKDSLQSFEMQVRQCLDCLTELLDNDDDMLALLLTAQAEAAILGEVVPYESHEEVELLLEEYARQLNNILFEINFLLQRLQSKQEFVSLALAGYRNRLIRMNLYLGVFGLSLGIGTTVAGFFGMNLISGYEQSPVVFGNVIMMTSVVGLGVAIGCANYVSGRTMQRRAKKRLEEIETLGSALGDMCALEYTLKDVMHSGKPMNKEEFKQRLAKARASGKVTDSEADLLFENLDTTRDGQISHDDFPSARRLHAPRLK